MTQDHPPAPSDGAAPPPIDNGGHGAKPAVKGADRYRRRQALAAIAAAAVVVGLVLATFGPRWLAGSPGSTGAQPAAPGTGPAISLDPAGPSTAPAGRSAAQPGLLPQAGYRATDMQQAGDCDGLPAVDPSDLRLLEPAADVVAAVVCTERWRDLPGEGRWKVRVVTDVPAASIPALVAALTEPDVVAPPNGACTAMLVMVPDFVLTLADGTRIRPGVPGDGCHPRDETSSALSDLDTWPEREAIRISQMATQEQVTTGCGGDAKSPAIWADATGGTASAQIAPDDSAVPAPPDHTGAATQAPPDNTVTPVEPLPGMPTTGAVAVCRYAAQDDPMLGTLSAMATVPASSVTAAIGALTMQAPQGCPDRATPEASPRTDWLMVQSLPAPAADEPAPPPLLSIELDGCRRVIGGERLTVLGYLAPDAATALGQLTG